MARPTVLDDESTPSAERAHRRPRRRVVALATCLVVLLLGFALVVPVGGDDPTSSRALDDVEVSDDSRRDRDGELTDSTVPPTSTAASDGLPTPDLASSERSASRAARGGSSGPPVLESVGSVVLDDGVYETDLVLRNTGGSLLSWNATTQPGDVVTPSSGVIPAGSETFVHLTADEYAAGAKHWTHEVVVRSDGGDAAIQVDGTTLLPGQPELVAGNWVNKVNETFDFPVGVSHAQLQIKNDGDLPLEMIFDPSPWGTIFTGNTVTIPGGELTFVSVTLCGIPSPVAPVVVNLPTSMYSAPTGDVPMTFRFHLQAGQVLPPC